MSQRIKACISIYEIVTEMIDRQSDYIISSPVQNKRYHGFELLWIIVFFSTMYWISYNNTNIDVGKHTMVKRKKSVKKLTY